MKIVVTAQRVEQNIQDVPLSISAVTGAEFEKLRLRDLSELQTVTPGLNLGFVDARRPVTTVRGVSFDPDSSATSTVDFYMNDTPIEAHGALRGQFDVQQIEVVRGPQATLRGGSAPSGAITVVTRRPDLEAFQGFIQQDFSDNGLINTQGAVGIPIISGKFGVRIAGLYDESDGEDVRNITRGENQEQRTTAGRITFLARPTDHLEIYAAYQHLKVEVDGFEDLLSVGPPSTGRPTLSAFDRIALGEGPMSFENELRYASLGAKWRLDGHLLSLTGGYNKNIRDHDRDMDFANIIPGFSARELGHTVYKQEFAELRFESTERPFWNYMLGADYYDTSTFTTNFRFDRSYFNFVSTLGVPGPFPTSGPLNLAGSPADCFTPGRTCPLVGYSVLNNSVVVPTQQENISVFTRQSLQFTSRFRLDAALRYREVKAARDVFLHVELPQLFTAFDQNLILPAFRDRDLHATTGSASFSYDFTDGVMGYVAYGHGWRPGSTSIVTTAFPPGSTVPIFDDEKNDSLELGIKSTLAGGRVRLNGAWFFQKFDGFQTRVLNVAVDANGNGCFRSEPGCPNPSQADGTDAFAPSITYNAPARVQGLEAELDAVLTERWTAGLNMTFSQAEFRAGAMAPCNRVVGGRHVFSDPAGNSTAATGVATCPRSGPLGNDPELTLSATSEYTMPVGSLEGYARGVFSYSGNHRNNDLVTPRRFGGYGLLNLYFGVRAANWEVGLWGKNVLDREALIDVSEPLVYSVFPSSYGQLSITRERELGITARYNFGE